MSKRKNRSSAPNIPSETLERARRQAAGENVDANAPQDPAPVSKSREERRAEMGVSSARRRYTATAAETANTPRPYAKRKRDELTVEDIDARLNNPDKFVTEEQLRAEYGYVLRDIRSMFILAGALFATLLVLGLVIS